MYEAGERKKIIDSLKFARANGIKTYEGKECPHHEGVKTKWVSNGSCLSCASEQSRKHKFRHKERLLKSRRDWDKSNPIKAMLQRSRRRAKDMGIEFDLSFEDIFIPELCPVFGMPLVRSGNKDCTPSLDRVDNSKGYVKGNIVVVSFKANRIKNNSTIHELKEIVNYYERNFSQ